MPRMSRLARPAVLLLACALPACVAKSTAEKAKGADSAPAQRLAPQTPASKQTVAAKSADSAQALPVPGTATVTPDSSLPKPSFEKLPGWLVIGGPFVVSPATSTDSVLIVFPFDSAWLRGHGPTPLALLQGDHLTSISAARRGEPQPYSQGIYLVVHGVPPVSEGRSVVGWLLRSDSAAGATAFPVHDSLSPDGNLRTWTAGPVRLVLKRVDKTSAQLTGSLSGVKPVDLESVAVNAETDSHMGIDSTTSLDLRDDWRIPKILAALRLGATSPIVVIVEESGYECANYRIIVFDHAGIELIEEPHYSYCGYNR